MKTIHHGRKLIRAASLVCLVVAFQLLAVSEAVADDGYRLWLRYDPLPADVVNEYRARVTSVVVQGRSPTLDAIRTELVGGCAGLLGGAVTPAEKVEREGAVVVGTP